ncbi:hypothetical protein [Clostridium butyricum]|uniref:hypothetical protein n=1 Tax=Clostridium butyricum TaxID=1492 RepID=UPI00325AA967
MNKEELQKIASTMTKDEFIDKYHYNSSDCPEDYGLKESSKICNGSGNCTKCWEEAICELEFKEDNIKNENKEKELNIIEASNLKNTEFKVIDSEGYMLDDNIKTNSNGHFLDMCGNLISRQLTYNLINAKFIPVEKPITFKESIESGKRFRVEYKIKDSVMNKLKEENSNYELYINTAKIYFSRYMNVCDFIYNLSRWFDSEQQREIILNGKYYLQED